jgi:enterochelin esterase-like enzyme
MKLLFLINLFVIPTILLARSGKVFDDLSLKSEILKMERKYSIYLPPDYDSSQRSYPVLYLLHGGGDDHAAWIQLGEMQQITDKAIREGKATPMIIVMPDANTGCRGYFNDIKGDWRYEDFFFRELIPFIEKMYHARPLKRYRAVSGNSMGGGGAFMYAMHHPEMFSSVCPLSTSVGPLSSEEAKKRYTRNNEIYPDSVIEEYYKKHNALSLIESMPDDQKKALRWYIDCGDDDYLFEGSCLIHIAMCKKEIPHEFRIRDGAHNWSYWRVSLPEVLEFISVGFR